MTVKYKIKKSKSILRKLKYVDTWFWCLYSLNPYQGCEYACEYCDSRSHKYHFHEDFDRTIYVKENAPDLLKKELKKKGYSVNKTLLDFGVNAKISFPKDVIAFSGVTDPYQSAELEFEITRKCLKVLRDIGFPVHIITKSDLVKRDSDILSEINEKSWACVSFTITTFDKDMVEIFEPRAPSPEKRIDTLKYFVNSGINTGVMFCPIIPFILDTDENIEEVIRKAKEAGADYVLFGAGMTLREGQKERFFEILKTHFPELIPSYKSIYHNMLPEKDYTIKVLRKAFSLCEKYGIRNYIKRPIPRKVIQNNYKVSSALYHIAFLLELREEDQYKIITYKKAAEVIEELKEDIENIHRKKELEEIPGIGKKVAEEVSEILETGKSDYLESLKL